MHVLPLVMSLVLQVPDPKVKYQQLLFYAKKLKPMAAALHTDDNKVQGCVSQANTRSMLTESSLKVRPAAEIHKAILCITHGCVCRSGYIHAFRMGKCSGRQTLTLPLPRYCSASSATPKDSA